MCSRRPPSARLYALLVTAISFAAGGYALFVAEPGVPVHQPAAMRYATECVTAARPLTQSFRVSAEAIRGVTIVPAAASGLSGQIVFELRAGQDQRVLSRVAIAAAELRTDEPFMVRTPRLARTGTGDFTLWVGRTSDAGCLKLLASGVSAPDADLHIGERQQWGDLVFQVHADRGTALHRLQAWLATQAGVALPLPILAVVALVYAVAIGYLCLALSSSVTSTSGRPSEG